MVCAHVLSDRIEMKPIGGLRSEHVSDIVVEQRVKCARNPFLVEPWGARAGSRDLHQTHVDRSEERRVGKECVVRVDLGGRRMIQKKNSNHNSKTMDDMLSTYTK